VAAEVLPKDQAPTLAQFYSTKFDELIAPSVAPSTAREYGYVFERHILPALGNLRITSLTTGAVNQFSASLLAAGYSPWTANAYVNVLSAVLSYAVLFGVVSEPPLKTRPKKYKTEKPCNELSDEEESRLLAAFDDEAGFRVYLAQHMPKGRPSEAPGNHFGGRRAHGAGLRSDGEAAGDYFRRYRRAKAIILLAVDLGLRLGDLLGLQWSSVDLTEALVSVVMKKTKRKVVVPISTRCLAVLAAFRAESPKAKFVLIDEQGRRYGVQRVRRYFTIAKTLAGFPEDRRIRLHDLRHTYGTKLARRSTPLLDISKMLGHSSIAVTQRYARVDETAIRTVRAAVNRNPE
jgi:integrase